MPQYFDNPAGLKDEQGTLSFTLAGHDYTLETNAGVFSKDKLDEGSRILLQTMLEHQEKPENLLDLGCGIGPIGVVLGSSWKCPVTGIDVNQRACQLAQLNYRRYQVAGKVICQDGIREGSFACIALNPPIRAGKSVIYRLFEEAADHLQADGSLWIVIRRSHGAESALRKLNELGLKTERVSRDKGFWVLRAIKEKI